MVEYDLTCQLSTKFQGSGGARAMFEGERTEYDINLSNGKIMNTKTVEYLI